MTEISLPLFGLAASFVGTALIRRHALGRGILDVPNARSSHTVPTPRGGGLAIVFVVGVALAALYARGMLDARETLALLVPGGAIAAVGYLDDRFGLSTALRFAVHLAAAALAVSILGVLPFVTASAFGALIVLAATVVCVCWAINLFNFMDGIDGIAASEAVFVAGAGAWLVHVAGGSSGVALALLAVATASLGFLVWNWQPARIFMGDVGSGFLGFVLVLLALLASANAPVPVWTWLILGSLFVADSTVTLVRRMLRRDRWYEAHRTHAYQRLARRWGSHARVTAAFVGVDVLVLLPLAWWSVVAPALAPYLTATVFVLAASAFWVAGAGRPEIEIHRDPDLVTSPSASG